MNRLVSWIRRTDHSLVCYVNHRWKCIALDWVMTRITHVGGASVTLLFLFSWGMIAPMPLKVWALQGFFALSASHLVVRLCKHFLPRIRPYLRLQLHTFPNPLADYSFPSGHTTAIFSIAVTFILQEPWTALLFFPLAMLVGLSRMYLGLHYPTDVAIGALLGSSFAIGSAFCFQPLL